MSGKVWDSVEALTASYTGHKGHLTRAEKRVNERLERLTALECEPMDYDLVQLETVITQLSTKVSTLELVGEDFLANFPDKFPKDLEAKVNAALKVVDKATDFLREKRVGSSNLTGQNGSEGDQRTKDSKVDYSIRPKELLGEESNFREFQAWYEGFEAFYQANNMVKMQMNVQFQQLRNCLKPEMQLWLKGVLSKKPNMEVNGPNGALVAIKNHFEQKYSLLRRRFDYWSYNRKDNQTMQD